MASIKLMRVEKDSFVPFSGEEITRLLNAPKVEEYAQFKDLCVLYLILDTGISSSEIFSLETTDIDFKSCSIILPASKNKTY